MVAPRPTWVLVVHQVFSCGASPVSYRHIVATIEAFFFASPLVLVVYLEWGYVRQRGVAL